MGRSVAFQRCLPLILPVVNTIPRDPKLQHYLSKTSRDSSTGCNWRIILYLSSGYLSGMQWFISIRDGRRGLSVPTGGIGPQRQSPGNGACKEMGMTLPKSECRKWLRLRCLPGTRNMEQTWNAGTSHRTGNGCAMTPIKLKLEGGATWWFWCAADWYSGLRRLDLLGDRLVSERE